MSGPEIMKDPRGEAYEDLKIAAKELARKAESLAKLDPQTSIMTAFALGYRLTVN